MSAARTIFTLAKFATGIFLGGMALASFAAETPVVGLTIKDHRFIPESIVAPAGQKFILRVQNADNGVEEFESSDLNRERIVRPGASTDIFLGPLSAGAYKFFGEFHPDTARGQLIAK
ncbi:MAG: cupredoxin domain-containing protein [Burkholderiales bacterium]